MINITNSDSTAIAYKEDNTDLHINIKDDFNERQIYLEATTRGDQKIQKEIFLGVKKSCQFIVPTTTVEYVFDHGYAGDTYGLNDVVSVMGATTSHIDVEGVATPHMNWSDPCNIDTIIFERFSDSNKLYNKTQTLKNQVSSVPTDQFVSQNGLCKQMDNAFAAADQYNPIGRRNLVQQTRAFFVFYIQ